MKLSNLLFLGGGGLLLWHLYDKERRIKDSISANRRRLMGASNPVKATLSTPGSIGKDRKPKTVKDQPVWDAAALRPWIISSAISLTPGNPSFTIESDPLNYTSYPFDTAWTSGMTEWFEGDSYFPQEFALSAQKFATPMTLMDAFDSQGWLGIPNLGDNPPNMVVLQPVNQVLIPIASDMREVQAMGGPEAYVDEMLNQIATFVVRIKSQNMIPVLVGPYPYGDAPYWGFEHQVWLVRLENGMKDIAQSTGAYYVDLISEFATGPKFSDDMGTHLTGNGTMGKVVVTPSWDLAEDMGMSIAQVMEKAARDNGLIGGQRAIT